VMFTNELFPRACTPEEGLKTEADWPVVPTHIRHGASLGSNATII
jgi:UDP-2-acetamido-3-amino-2,3-dideoxy-glucuronate N-acetyltransferase